MMIWSNPDMVSNIHETIEMLDLTMNAGVLSTNKKAYLLRWGEVWFSTDLVTNIFSLAQISDAFYAKPSLLVLWKRTRHSLTKHQFK
jgi:hypothetical protein